MRKLIFAAILATFSFGATAQEAAAPGSLEEHYTGVTAVNTKTFMEAGSRVQAMLEAALAQQTVRAAALATASDNRLAILAERSLSEALNGQTTGAIEGAAALSKINTSDLPALISNLMGAIAANKEQQQTVAIPVSPTNPTQ